jgi:hypothetical protein
MTTNPYHEERERDRLEQKRKLSEDFLKGEKLRLETKYQDLPYALEYRYYRTSAFWVGAFINLVSAATASSLVYFYLTTILPYWLAVTFTFLFLGGLEAGKRLLWPKTFELIFHRSRVPVGFLIIGVLMLASSIAASYWGFQMGADEFSERAEELSVFERFPEAQTLAKEKETLEARLSDYQKNKDYRTSSGELDWNIRTKTVPEIEARLSSIGARIAELESLNTGSNGILVTTTNNTIAIRAEYGAGVVVLLDFLFIFLCGYIEFHDYTSAEDFNVFRNKKKGVTKEYKKPTPSGKSKEELKKKKTSLAGSIRSYKSQLSGDPDKDKGKLEKIEEWEAELEEIKKELSD